jgi:hypothetical protein
MADITLTNTNTSERIALFIARDDTNTFVVSSYRPGRDQHASLRTYELPSPFAARAAMCAYAKDLQSRGFTRLRA